MVNCIILALGCLFLIAFLIVRDRRSSIIAIIFKTLTSLCFVTLAFAAAYYRDIKGGSSKDLTIIFLLTFVGLICGLIGDIMLDFKIYFKGLNYSRNIKDSDLVTYAGMIAFAIGHIFYISATLVYENTHLVFLLYSSVTALIFSLLFIFGVGWRICKLNFDKFLIPSLIYCFLLSNFLFLSLIILISNPNMINGLRFAGSALFFISDAILSMTYFSESKAYGKVGPLNPESRFMICSNHITYYIAQFILAILLFYL